MQDTIFQPDIRDYKSPILLIAPDSLRFSMYC